MPRGCWSCTATRAALEHRVFRDIGDYLRPGDLLVLNQTRVIPARLFGRKAPPAVRSSCCSCSRRDERTWEALVRGKGLRPGRASSCRATSDDPTSGHRSQAEIIAGTGTGSRLVRFEQPIEPLLDKLGVVPLPPYIHEPLADPERYQTVYGRVEGSVAASTAGLHFTPDLLVDLRRHGRRDGLCHAAHRAGHLSPGEGRAGRGSPDPHRVVRADRAGGRADQPRPPGGPAGGRRGHHRRPGAGVGGGAARAHEAARRRARPAAGAPSRPTPAPPICSSTPAIASASWTP